MRLSIKLINSSQVDQKKERTEITNTRNETDDVTTNPKDNERIIRDYNKQLYANKFNNLDENNKFLENTNYQGSFKKK